MTEKFISPSPPPEGLDRELLTILAEECCEIGQRVSKALRFGLYEVQPGQDMSNAQRISEEIGDLLAVVQRLEARFVLFPDDITKAVEAKHAKLNRFLQSEA